MGDNALRKFFMMDDGSVMNRRNKLFNLPSGGGNGDRKFCKVLFYVENEKIITLSLFVLTTTMVIVRTMYFITSTSDFASGNESI